MEWILLRHGKTEGNLAGRYNGWTDDPLSDEGASEAALRVFAEVTLAYVSPLKRACRTAAICFPNAKPIVLDGLKEMSFGDFEGRTAKELALDPVYQAWVEGECREPCPNGESMPGFAERAAAAFVEAARDARERKATLAGVMAHGGTIMAIMHRFARADCEYFDWYVPNCGGYRFETDDAWEDAPTILRYEQLEELAY